jgi:hypothetical protein
MCFIGQSPAMCVNSMCFFGQSPAMCVNSMSNALHVKTPSFTNHYHGTDN